MIANIQRTCLTVGLLLFAHHLSADNVSINWVGPTGNAQTTGENGNWSDAAAWDRGVVPNNSGGTTYAVSAGPTLEGQTITVDISPTIDSLSLNNTSLSVNAGQTLSTGTLGVTAAQSAAGVDVSTGATLNASTASFLGNGSFLTVGGTATFGELDLSGNPSTSFGVATGGLVNADSGGFLGSAGIGGTVNIAHASRLNGFVSISGTLDLNTGNQSPLDSTNTLVNGGAVSFSASGNSGFDFFTVGDFAPGVFAGLTIADGTLDEVISSPTQFGSFLSEDGNAQLGGNLDITLANGFIPQVGETFQILQTSGLAPSDPRDPSFPPPQPAQVIDTFHTIEGLTFNNGTEKWDIVYKPTEVDLVATAVATPEPSMFVLAGLGLFAICASRVLRRIRVQ